MKAGLLVSVSIAALIASNAVCAAEPVRPIPNWNVLYDQNSNDAGYAVPSEIATSGSSYTSRASDDFVIPSGHRWRIKEVDVPANQKNPTLWDVEFYNPGSRGLPGGLFASCDDIPGTDVGYIAIKIPKSCLSPLQGGKRYWMSAIADGHWL